MKLFKITSETQTQEMVLVSGEVVFPAKTVYECDMIDETDD